jgi:peptide/nickel transport system substrate-binding protein
MEFRVLGSFEVVDRGSPLALGPPQQRALLAVLLVHRGEPVSSDRLIDEIWGEQPPPTAHKIVQGYVSNLRKALGDGLLVTEGRGYGLRLEPGQLDVDRFESLVAQAREALEDGDALTAGAVLRDALGVWRGPALADFAYERFAQAEIARLEEARLAALEDRIDADLASGEQARLVGELEALVREHPLRERLRAQLMLALYRSGRQADALESYRKARQALVEELGLEPGPRLQELERAILAHDPALDAWSGPSPAAPMEPPRDPAVPPPSGRRGNTGRRLVVAAVVALVIVAGALVVRLSREPRKLTAVANSIGEIDAKGKAVGEVIPMGGRPGGIAAGGGSVWVTDTTQNQLLQIDVRHHSSVERIPVGHGPTGVATGDGEVWVVDQLDRTVSEINPHALTAVGSFPVGAGADAVAFGNGSLWVANTVDDTLSHIDPAHGALPPIPLPGGPAGVAVGRDGVWVTIPSTGQLLLIDARSNQVTQAFPIGNGPAGVAVGGGQVWVADTPAGTLWRFDPDSGKPTPIPVGREPVGVAYGAGAVWVANSLDGTIARVDPKSGSVTHVHVGGVPTALATTTDAVWSTVQPSPFSHRGGTLRVGIGAGYSSFRSLGNSVDPAGWAGLAQRQMLGLTNDGLVTYRKVGGLAGGMLVPDLATTLPAPADGGLTYTFRVRTGIRYSTGALIRPSDFRRAIERVFMIDQTGYARVFYTGIVGARRCLERSTPNRATRRQPAVPCSLNEGIVADNAAGTVTFHLTAADPDFLYKLAFPWADAVPASTPDRDLRLAPPPATGPYMTSAITPPRPHSETAFRTWTMVRNPRFHEWSRQAQPDGYPDRIVLSDGVDAQDAVDQVERDGLDVLFALPANRVHELQTRYTSQLHSDPAAQTTMLVLNTRVAPFDRVSVRRALNYALDRGRITALAGGSLQARTTCQILPPTMPGYQPYCPYTNAPNPGGGWSAPDLATAQALVRASGTHGMKVTVLVPGGDSTFDTEIGVGRHTVSVLNRLGYRASLRTDKHYYDDLAAADSRKRVQISWLSWIQDYPAPSNFINPTLTCSSFKPGSTGNLNWAEFCNHAIDADVERAGALQALSPGQANQVWARIDHEITDQAPWVPLYNPRAITATSARVGNYQYHPFWTQLLDQLWVK